jgi:hypothetical protein
MHRIIPAIGVGKILQTLLLTPLGIISRMGFIAVLFLVILPDLVWAQGCHVGINVNSFQNFDAAMFGVSVVSNSCGFVIQPRIDKPINFAGRDLRADQDAVDHPIDRFACTGPRLRARFQQLQDDLAMNFG